MKNQVWEFASWNQVFTMASSRLRWNFRLVLTEMKMSSGRRCSRVKDHRVLGCPSNNPLRLSTTTSLVEAGGSCTTTNHASRAVQMRAHCGKQMKRNQHEGISEILCLKTLSSPFALVYLEAYLIFFGGAIDLVSTQHA